MKKFVLVTGASGGIGKATAIELAKKGWNLYLHYNRNTVAIKQLLNELEPYNVELIPIQADLSTDEGIEKLINNIFHIHAICYVSGISYYGLFIDTTDDILEKMWKVHVFAPMKIIKDLLPKLMRNSSSQIVLVSSIWGQTGASCEVAYSTVKGAQLAFVKALSKEVARNGVRINAVAPGAVDTNMLAMFSKEEQQELKDEIPIGRLACPDEVASVNSFLLSEKSSYITGQVLSVNGGWYT
ncbi:3-oxoacyl-ACP reductase [Heyndrickxia sporothermodurans]|uniref:elongation factor P 5-aminopentanone reductase n=1 Tax=Heyndrickxia sporothermodurans TaxID=46224 RepID=UPI000D353640|nr:SDR family oxidoreductase [Heyndrickxia sporothermodurans]PTY79729.1 3-oxoacyl-ACP reductase [Heyndrickxia sporothermodurans]